MKKPSPRLSLNLTKLVEHAGIGQASIGRGHINLCIIKQLFYPIGQQHNFQKIDTAGDPSRNKQVATDTMGYFVML